ncbi:hypothetical protein Tco_0012610 [Tanacetum coccineum]
MSQKRRFIQNTSKDDSEKENDELRLHLTIAPDEEKKVDYEILDRKYPIKEWKIECLGTKPQDDKAEHLEEINQNVRNLKGLRIFFVLSVWVNWLLDDSKVRYLKDFDRDTLGGVDYYRSIQMHENDVLGSQQDWNIVSWKLHSSSGLESEEDNTMALELIRFIKKLLAELEPEDFDGDEEDL